MCQCPGIVPHPIQRKLATWTACLFSPSVWQEYYQDYVLTPVLLAEIDLVTQLLLPCILISITYPACSRSHTVLTARCEHCSFAHNSVEAISSCRKQAIFRFVRLVGTLAQFFLSPIKPAEASRALQLAMGMNRGFETTMNRQQTYSYPLRFFGCAPSQGA